MVSALRFASGDRKEARGFRMKLKTCQTSEEEMDIDGKALTHLWHGLHFVDR